jgi:DNA-binding ferritin-like protein
MTTSLEELRKYYSMFKDIGSKIRSILGTLPAEVETLIGDIDRELTALEGFDHDAKTTWSLHPKRRRLQKQIDEGIPKLEDSLAKALQLFVELLRNHLDELAEIKAELLAFDLKLGRDLGALSIPSTKGSFKVVLPVLARFVTNFEKLVKTIRASVIKQANESLDQNRALIKTYDRFVGIDTSDVSLSAEREVITEVSIPELFKVRDVLRTENEYLTSRRGEVVEALQSKLKTSVETSLSILETAKSLGLKVPAAISTQLKDLMKRTSASANLTALLGLVQKYDGQILKASSEVRSQILEAGHILNRILADANISLDASFLPKPLPEVGPDADLATLITSFERFQAYQTNVETAIRSETMKIIDELTRAAKRKVLPSTKDLNKFIKSNLDKIEKASLKDLVGIYSSVSSRMIDENGNLLAGLRAQEALLTRISETASTILDKTALGAAPAPVETANLSFSDLVEAYARFQKHVENRIDLFRKAWERELNALLAEIQVIKPTYRESFKTMEDFLQSAIELIRKSTNFEEIETVALEAQGDALYKAQDAIENLKYRLDLKLRLAVSKLLGMGLAIPAEVQAAIQELGTIAPASETYEEAIRKSHAIVDLFERRIVGYFNQTLNEQIKAFSDLMTVSASLGIKTDTFMKELVTLQEKLPANIEDLPDRFDELRDFLMSPQLLKDIRMKANEVWGNLNSVTKLLEQHGQAEIVTKLKTLLARVPEELSTESVTTVLEICLALLEAQKSVMDVIRNLEQKTSAAFEEHLEKTAEYYSTIRRVYLARTREFSKTVFPLQTVENLRQRMTTIVSLPEAIDLFTTIRRLESQWEEKLVEIDEWHKALRVFLADYNPGAPKAERNRQLDEIEKRIRDTYTREDTASYLSWAARELAAAMSEKRNK